MKVKDLMERLSKVDGDIEVLTQAHGRGYFYAEVPDDVVWYVRNHYEHELDADGLHERVDEVCPHGNIALCGGYDTFKGIVL